MKPFVFLGPSHVTALALTLAVPVVLTAVTRARKSWETRIRWGLAALIAVNWLAWMLLLAERGWLGVGNAIPLNLCDWATMATFIALVNPTQKSYELAYFWALCGTTQALITPDCVYDFPDAQFTLFFIYHGSIVASVLYLTLSLTMRPYPASIARVTGWTLFYGATAGAADWLLGTNYGFLRAKPAHFSLLDIMSPWPWYLPELLIAGVLFMLFWYAPFAIVDLWPGVQAARRAWGR
ncbi:MAG TPA: TIGR02206 family membrane protein [Rhizomicrobium sp.]